MNYKKTILGAASVFALLAGATSPSSAAIDPNQEPPASPRVSQASGVHSDPLFAFIVSANGGDTVEIAINDLFGSASGEQVRGFPQFLASIGDLGLSPDAVQRSREALIEIASSSSELDESTRQLVVAQLENQRCTAELAAQGRCRERDPSTTGSIGAGAAGGVYQ